MKHTIHKTVRIGILSIVIISMVVSGFGGFIDIGPTNPIQEAEAATSWQTLDTQTFTENDPNNRIYTNNSNAIEFEDVDNDETASIYKNINAGTNLTGFQYDIYYNYSSTGASHFIGLEPYAQPSTGDYNSHQGYGIVSSAATSMGLEIENRYLDRPQIGQLDSKVAYNVKYEFNEDTAKWDITVTNKSSGNIVIQETVVYPPPEDMDVVMLSTRSTGGGGVSFNADITDLQIRTETPANRDINLENSTINDPNNKINVSENWISTNRLANTEVGWVEHNKSGPGVGAARLKYTVYHDDTNSGLGAWFTRTSGLDDIADKALGVNRYSSVDYFRSAEFEKDYGMDTNTNQFYYVTYYKYAHNGTHRIEYYTDKSRTNRVYKIETEYPAAVPYDVFYPLNGRSTLSDSSEGSYLIGNFEYTKKEEPANEYINMSAQQEPNDEGNKVFKSKNWVTVTRISGSEKGVIVFNNRVNDSYNYSIKYIEEASVSYDMLSTWGNRNDISASQGGTTLSVFNYQDKLYPRSSSAGSSPNGFDPQLGQRYYITFTQLTDTIKLQVYNDSDRTDLYWEDTQTYDNSTNFTASYAYISDHDSSGTTSFNMQYGETSFTGFSENIVIDGTVTNDNNNPLDNATVELLDVNSDASYTTTTNASGYYSLEVPSNTNYSGWYSKRGYEQETKYIEPQTQTTYDVSLTQKTPLLYGYVYDNQTGSTIENASISAAYKDENGITHYVTTETDVLGYYEVQLEADEYNVTANKVNYIKKYNASWYIDEDTQRDWYIDPQGNNTINGYVTDTQGQAIEGATVEIGQNYSIESDAQGYYELLVPNGTYNLTASKQGYQDDTYTSQSITSDATYDFTLNGTVTYSVDGYVHNDRGDPIDNAVIYVSNDTSVVETASTDPNGYYSLSGLAEGSYTFNATKNLYQNDSAYLYIALDDIQNFTLRAERQIELKAQDVIWEQSESDYNVTLVIPAYSENVDVTDQATVTSSNTTRLTVDSTNHILQSYSYKGNVTVNATYNNYHDNKTIIVANQTAENVGIFKDWGQMTAAIWGNPVDPNTGEAPGGTQLTMAMLFVALLVGIALSSWASAFAGIGGITVTVVFGWMMGWVGDGMVLVTLFTGLFIGLNLAANVDYEMRN